MAHYAFTPPCGFDLAATTIRDLDDLTAIASWGYRVVQHPNGMLFVHEAYYDADDALLGFAIPPTRLCGESLEAIREEMAWMQEGLDEPTLAYADFGEATGAYTRYGWDGEGEAPGGPV